MWFLQYFDTGWLNLLTYHQDLGIEEFLLRPEMSMMMMMMMMM